MGPDYGHVFVLLSTRFAARPSSFFNSIRFV